KGRLPEREAPARGRGPGCRGHRRGTGRLRKELGAYRQDPDRESWGETGKNHRKRPGVVVPGEHSTSSWRAAMRPSLPMIRAAWLLVLARCSGASVYGTR